MTRPPFETKVTSLTKEDSYVLRDRYMKECLNTTCDTKQASHIMFHEGAEEPEFVCFNCMLQISKEKMAIYNEYSFIYYSNRIALIKKLNAENDKERGDKILQRARNKARTFHFCFFVCSFANDRETAKAHNEIAAEFARQEQERLEDEKFNREIQDA